MQVAIAGFLLLAPAVLVGASIFAIMGHAGSNAGFLAFFYFAAGPFVSAVWTMLVPRIIKCWSVRRATGESYKGGHLQTWGLCFFGFFGTLAAEVAFYFAFSAVSTSVAAFFALAPFVVFFPLIAYLVLGGGLKSAVRRYQYRKAQAEYARFSRTGTTKGMNSFEVWSALRYS